MSNYGFEDLPTVLEVTDVEHSYADIAVITETEKPKEARLHWLKRHRDELQMVGRHTDEIEDRGFIQFRVKE